MSGSKPSKIVAGGYYYTKDAKGYQVIKVLKVEPSCVHIRVFKNLFASPPTIDDIPDLSINMTIDDLKQEKITFGMAHLPLDPKGFIEENPILFATLPVTEDELEGYREWKSQSGL